MPITTTENDIKERLSLAFVTAVAARAGCQVVEWSIDKTSVDATIRPVSGTRACVDVQMKATSTNPIDGAHLIFDLPVKNYEDLRKVPQTHPHYLAVLHLQGALNDWLSMTPEQLSIKGVAYWGNLVSLPTTQNTATVRVRLPVAQRFTPDALTRMIEAAPNPIGAPGQ